MGRCGVHISARVCLAIGLIVSCWATPATYSQSGDARSADDLALRAYLTGNGLLNRGLYELATTEYRKFLSDHDDHDKAPIARYGLAVSLFRLERYDEAVTELERLQELSRFDYAPQVATMAGQCHLIGGRYEPAAKAFEKVVRSFSDDDLADDASAGLVEALYRNKKYDRAIKEAGTFSSRWEDGALRERVEFFAGLAEMALRNYTAAAERFTRSLEAYAKGPFADQTSLLLAQCHQADRSVDKAISQYRAVLKRGVERLVPDALLSLGTLLYETGEFDAAGATLDRLLAEADENSRALEAWFQRGRVHFAQNEYDRAFKAFRRVAKVEGKSQDAAAYWMAKCKLRSGDYEEAARRMRAAAEKFSESDLQPEMHYDRAVALLQAEELDDAIDALETFYSRFDDHVLAPTVLHLLAATEHRRESYDNSLAHCRTFLDRHMGHELTATVRFLSAENHFLSGRHSEAVDGFREFLSGHESDPQALKAKFRLAIALHRLEKYDQAEPLLVELASVAKQDAVLRPVLLALGDIHFHRCQAGDGSCDWKQVELRLTEYLSGGLGLPSADDALVKLAFTRQRMENHEAALGDYDQLIEHFADSPHRLQALFERGQVLVALDRLDEARPAFEQLLSEGEDSRFAPYALNHLGAIAMQKQEFELAAELFERAGAKSPTDGMTADLLFRRGQAHMAQREYAKAEGVLRRHADEFSNDARNAQVLAQLAIAVSRQGRHEDALEAVERVERGPVDRLTPSLRSSLRYEKAWCLRELGRSDEASETYTKLLDTQASEDVNLHAMLELGEIEAGAKRYEPAAKVLHRLREALSERSSEEFRELREQGTYRLAVCEFELGRFDEAGEFFEELLSTFDGSSLRASAGFYAGESRFKTGRHERAAVHFARVVKEHGSDAVAGPSLLRLGECLAILQRWAASEKVFSKYLGRFAESEHWFQARFGVGWARENQKRYNEAIKAYGQVVERHKGPTAARAQFQIGQCFFAEGKYEEAVRELLKVDILYAYPQWSAAAVYEAGRCFEKLGRPTEARAHFGQVRDNFEDTEWAQLATRRLSELSAAAALPGQ